MHAIVPERMIALREAAGFSQEKLAEVAGVGQSTIQRLEAGLTRNPRNVFDLAVALKTTPQYLLGQGDDPSPDANALALVSKKKPVVPTPPAMMIIREIDLAYGLGSSYLDQPAPAELLHGFPIEFIRSFTRSAPEQLFLARGIGDSMEPTIHDSDLVLVDRAQDRLTISDKVWVIALGNIGMIKRLQPQPGGAIKVTSDNKAVRDIDASEDELHIIGRVVGVMRKF